MAIDYKLKTKRLLQGCALKLFFIKLASLLLRYGCAFAGAFMLLLISKSSLYENLRASYGALPVAVVFYSLCSVIISLCLLFFFGIKLGENMCFFEKANGKPVNIRLLFKHLKIYTCTQAIRLYAKIYLNKLLWLLLFATPCFACVCCLQLLLWQNLIDGALYYILSGATSVVISASIIMWRISSLRYSAAPYIFCLDPQKDTNTAIKQSVLSTDTLLDEAISNDIYLFYKNLSCILILPIAYNLLYTRLFKVAFITDAIDMSLKISRLCKNVD